jgi:hypothetical protein
MLTHFTQDLPQDLQQPYPRKSAGMGLGAENTGVDLGILHLDEGNAIWAEIVFLPGVNFYIHSQQITQRKQNAQ